MEYCKLWYFMNNFLLLMSMYVVMLLSISRAIAILFPFYKVNKKAALISVLVYAVYTILWSIIPMLPSLSDLKYAVSLAHCYIEFETKIGKSLVSIIWTVLLILPPVAVFIAFITSTVKLLGERSGSTLGRKNRQASITIAYFTAVFLFCNSLTFANTFIYTIYKEKVYSTNKFAFFYSWIISDSLCPVINAALNPIVYVYRMKNLRNWILNRGTTRRVIVIPNPVISPEETRN